MEEQCELTRLQANRSGPGITEGPWGEKEVLRFMIPKASGPVPTPDSVFLDRDGVINENRADHVKNWSEFRFLPGSLEALARLASAGLRVFVITNQAVINRGIVPKELVEEINLRMVDAVESRGGKIDGVAYCPHRPEEMCRCRKPRPGLLLDLAAAYGIDLARSVMVGDALSDLAAGRAAGCETLLLLTGRGKDQLAQARASGVLDLHTASDLLAATEWILQRREKWVSYFPLSTRTA